jgi:twinkle protein
MQLIDDDFDWNAYYELPERAKVLRPSQLSDAVVADLDPPPGAGALGAYLPWEKAQDRLRLRPGEVTVWAGPNGSWKSALTTQVALGLMRQGERVLIASFEMRPARTLSRMACMAAGTDQPAIPYVRTLARWSDDRLWVFDHYGECDPRKAVAVCRYAARDLGVRHVVIDSLMKCVVDPEDYRGQKLMVGELCTLAMAHGAHVHLVAHLRKAKDDDADYSRRGKSAIQGSGGVTDQVDNVVLVQRNKAKERRIADGRADDAVRAQPDVFLHVDKQRHAAFEDTIGLFLDRKSFAFTDRDGARAHPIELKTLQNALQATQADSSMGGSSPSRSAAPRPDLTH